jgi:hypothetical protein
LHDPAKRRAIVRPAWLTCGIDELARLKELITRHAGAGAGVTRTPLPRVSVVCSRSTTEPASDIAEPTLAVVAQGVKETALNGHPFAYRAGQFLIVAVELPVNGHVV